MGRRSPPWGTSPTGSPRAASLGLSSSSPSSRISPALRGRAMTLTFGVTLYADDAAVWVAQKDPKVVKDRMERLSASQVSYYVLQNSLSLNPGKIQVLWTGTPSPLPIMVGPTLIQPQEELVLLGITFDKKLSIRPHLRAQEGTARSLLALTRRLLLHLPRGRHVQDIVRSLVVGRLCYGNILVPPRLASEDPTCHLVQLVQTLVNDMAQLLLGDSRANRIPVERLLLGSGLPSINRTLIKPISFEAWKCLRSCDGPGGIPNTLGEILSTSSPSLVRQTRSTSTCALPPPLQLQADMFIWFVVKLYNEFPSLRSAPSLAAAKRAAESISSAAPL